LYKRLGSEKLFTMQKLKYSNKAVEELKKLCTDLHPNLISVEEIFYNPTDSEYILLLKHSTIDAPLGVALNNQREIFKAIHEEFAVNILE